MYEAADAIYKDAHKPTDDKDYRNDIQDVAHGIKRLFYPYILEKGASMPPCGDCPFLSRFRGFCAIECGISGGHAGE